MNLQDLKLNCQKIPKYYVRRIWAVSQNITHRPEPKFNALMRKEGSALYDVCLPSKK